MTRDEYGMELARVASLMSKDPSTKVGCCIMAEDGTIVSLGRNGTARGADDAKWVQGSRDLKLAVTLHAELNGILNASRPVAGCTAYVYPLPTCSHCAAVLAQSGIKRVVCYGSQVGDRWHDSAEIGKELILELGLEYTTIERAE
jgi:dCMP deaminase